MNLLTELGLQFVTSLWRQLHPYPAIKRLDHYTTLASWTWPLHFPVTLRMSTLWSDKNSYGMETNSYPVTTRDCIETQILSNFAGSTNKPLCPTPISYV